MQVENQKTAAVIILAGSLMFLVAAFMPYSRVFAEKDPGKRMEIIQSKTGQWNIGQVLFALGSLVTAAGFGLFLIWIRQKAGTGLAWSGGIAMGIGSVLWTWHTSERLVSPGLFAQGIQTPYLFTVYSIFTQAGLIMLGVFFLKWTQMSAWVGWMLIVAPIVLAVLMVIFRDMPPFVYYVFTAILVVKLLVDTGSNPVN